MDVDQVLLQHPLVPNLRPADRANVLRILAALFPLVSDQGLHPPVLLAAFGAEVSSESLVIV